MANGDPAIEEAPRPVRGRRTDPNSGHARPAAEGMPRRVRRLISGLLYVHCKNAEYKALVAKRSKAQGRWNAELSQRERLIVETSMHEYFHYLQVLSCGYLFETVAALSDALTGTLNRFKQDGSDDARLAGFGRIARNILRSLRHRDEGSIGLADRYHRGRSLLLPSTQPQQVSDHDGMLKAVALPACRRGSAGL